MLSEEGLSTTYFSFFLRWRVEELPFPPPTPHSPWGHVVGEPARECFFFREYECLLFIYFTYFYHFRSRPLSCKISWGRGAGPLDPRLQENPDTNMTNLVRPLLTREGLFFRFLHYCEEVTEVYWIEKVKKSKLGYYFKMKNESESGSWDHRQCKLAPFFLQNQQNLIEW